MGDLICGECARLRQQYASAADSHKQFEGDLQAAFAERKGELATVLTIAVKAAHGAMERARRQLREHQFVAHLPANGNNA